MATEPQSSSGAKAQKNHFAIVAGYGLPGRSLVESLGRRGIPYRVIELNPQACHRASAGGVNMIIGDASDPAILGKAGVERATLVALMVPSDEVVLRAVSEIRAVNSSVHIIARCAYTSSGLEALRRGANQTIVAEQLVAKEIQELGEQFFV
jgi:CPA2 family monovalent cation:H+ antiporter-2